MKAFTGKSAAFHQVRLISIIFEHQVMPYANINAVQLLRTVDISILWMKNIAGLPKRTCCPRLTLWRHRYFFKVCISYLVNFGRKCISKCRKICRSTKNSKLTKKISIKIGTFSCREKKIFQLLFHLFCWPHT